MPEFVDLLRAKGRSTEVRRVERPQRTFDSFEGLATFLRRQLWVEEDGEKDRRFRTRSATWPASATTTAGRWRRRWSARSGS